MQKPVLPADEIQRLQELIALEILDTDGESAFNAIVELASHITQCPVSLISLIDVDRQWFKAKVGTDVPETSRDISFCGHAIHQDEAFIIENALEDSRFFDNPLVTGETNIRFYAGQPLITSNGYKIGTLCAIDQVPRVLNEDQKKHLAALAKQVMYLLELRLLNRRQKLESLTQSQFLANISHEIRTPMTGILGYASMAQDHLDTPVVAAEKTSSYLRHIERHSKHVLSIVGNILDLSKIESGPVELKSDNFSLRELKDDLLSLFEREAQKKGVLFEVIIQENVPAYLNSDFVRLKQILINLAGNALKFTEKGAVRIKIAFNPDDHRLTMSVQDTGCGMSKEQSARIFKPFMQADASIFSKYGGTGLGLALSKQIAQSMGGELILAHSSPNEGSRFVATVITQPAKVSEAEIPAKPLAGTDGILKNIGATSTVLVADDSKDNRYIIKHYLKKLGITADEASNGEEVLSKVTSKNYDVIFLDLSMPDQDGFQVLEKIHALRRKVKVVAFTAHNSPEYREKTKQAGFNGFLTKPFTAAEVGKILLDMLVSP